MTDTIPTPAPDATTEATDDVAEQWERARAKVEAAEKEQPSAPAAEAKPKAEATDEAEDTEAEADSDGEDEDDKAHPGTRLAKARAMLQKGDLDGALKAAFGKTAKDFAINSKQWQAWREKTQEGKRALAAKEQQLMQAAQELQKRFAPLHQARQEYEAGNLTEAFKLAFGEDINDFQRKALRQKMGQDPEVAKLKRQLEEEKQARIQREREAQERYQAEQEEHMRRQYFAGVQKQLGELEPHIQKVATKRAFFQAVVEQLQEHYDPDTNITIPVSHAAELAFAELYGDVWDSGVTGTPHTPAATVQGGSSPVRPAARAAKNLKQSHAAEASAPGRLSDDELLAKYEKLMKLAATG